MFKPSATATSVAFFDLDKTILSTSSPMALRHPLRKAGLLTRRGAALGILTQLPYLLGGGDEYALKRMAEALGQLSKGWDRKVLESVVHDALITTIDPVCYTEALDLIALHKADDDVVVLASASLEEMVRPIAQLIGADYAIGTIGETDEDDRFTGVINHINHHGEKAQACIDFATKHGFDLDKCFAYSDSISDLPLLEAVGHPVAVNPDKQLRAIAEEQRWQILFFHETARVRQPTARFVLPAAAGSLAVGISAFALWKAHRLLRQK